MSRRQVAIVAADLVSAYGQGIDCCWQGMLEKVSAVSEVERFSTANFTSNLAAVVPGIDSHADNSLIEQMLDMLDIVIPPEITTDCNLFLATTVGEIDLLEQVLEQGMISIAASQLLLLEKIQQHWELSGGRLINAACASSTIALSRAASMIANGTIASALVVATDCVSEFVFSGFSALGAMSSQPARPFDAERDGLTLGEAAGAVLLLDADLARHCQMPILALVNGWGMSCDAKHMTAPDASGKALSRAVKLALQRAGIAADEIGGIMAHGTGTIYNDAMEMAALRRSFTAAKPLFSTKFGTGHTLAAAGIIQTAMALKVLENQVIPGQGNLNCPLPGAEEWVQPAPRSITSSPLLVVNAGFGGINAALIIENYTAEGGE